MERQSEEEVLFKTPYEEFDSGPAQKLGDSYNISAVPRGLRGANEGILILNENNRNHFGRRVFLDDSGLPKYMRSTIGSLFDSAEKKPAFPLDKKLTNADLNEMLLGTGYNSSSHARKVDFFPQNKPVTNEQIEMSYHN